MGNYWGKGMHNWVVIGVMVMVKHNLVIIGVKIMHNWVMIGVRVMHNWDKGYAEFYRFFCDLQLHSGELVSCVSLLGRNR